MVMFLIADIDMADTVNESDIGAFSPNQHGLFTLPITQYSRPYQEQFDIPFLADWEKIGQDRKK